MAWQTWTDEDAKGCALLAALLACGLMLFLLGMLAGSWLR
jgi:hypothetical protein